MPIFIAGNRSTVTINSTEVGLKTVSFKENCKLIEKRNSQTNQFTLYIPTFTDADISIFIDHDTTSPYYKAPLSVKAGAILSCKIYLNEGGNDTLDGPYYTITTMVIRDVDMNAVVDGDLGIRINAKASGTYSYPTT
jgi:hypothetical protein